MKTQQRLAAISAAAFILSGSFPIPAAGAGQVPEDTSLSEYAAEPEDAADYPLPDEAPPFHARMEFRMGYTVIGTFTDFTPDITRIQTLYSLDGENWQTCGADWNLFNLGSDNEYLLAGLQNQPCLLSGQEPLKSYIAGEIDRFYLKLRITKKNGLSYETQPDSVERGSLQPIPEGAERRACFSSAIAVQEYVPGSPYRYHKYGQYQITVSADTTAEDVSALLPDTLPVEIQLDHGADFMAIGVIDCPVTWKPLSLPSLSAGESITVLDAAEEIIVPKDTQVSTPIGVFLLDEPLSLDTLPSTDEVRLVLNVSPESRDPAGVLKEDTDGLKIALHQKPTGALSIQAYVLKEGETEWTELSGLSLLKEMDSQPSTENSGYALVLRRDQEPYQSYLAAQKAGTAPVPFFIGLKIEGGIYDGRQLILSWPDTYEQLPDLPKIDGAEGNEGNAGAGNKGDSTESGQRPNLPDPSGTGQEGQPEPPVHTPDDSGQALNESGQALDESGQKQQTAQEHTAEHASVPSDGRNTASADEPVPERQEEPFLSGRLPYLSQTAPDTAGASTVNRADSSKSSSPAAVTQAGADTDTADEDIVPVLSDEKIPSVHTAENKSLLLILAAAAIAAGGGICYAFFCKAAGCSLFCRIAGKIRKKLRR